MVSGKTTALAGKADIAARTPIDPVAPITVVDLLVVVRRQSTLKRPSSSYAAAGGDDRKRTLTSRAVGGKRSALKRARAGCAARYTRMGRSQACLSIR